MSVTHTPAITRPMSPGGPYVITCGCGFVAEAHYPTAALVGAYTHEGDGWLDVHVDGRGNVP